MTYRIEQLLSDGVRDKVLPGAMWAVGDTADIHASGSTGVLDPNAPGAPMRPDTIFDAASRTKILAVRASIGAFWEEGKLGPRHPSRHLLVRRIGQAVGQ